MRHYCTLFDRSRISTLSLPIENRETAPQTIQQCAVSLATTSRPLFYSQRLSVMGRKDSISFVGLLNGHISPSAITRRVWTIVVDSVKRQSFGAWTHVREEIMKRHAPSIAHNDSTATITLKDSVFAIVAALSCCVPNSIFSPLLFGIFGPDFQCEAPTTYRDSSLETGPDNNSGTAAITDAKPLDTLESGRAFNNGPSAKSISGKVYKIVNTSAKLCRSHAIHPPLMNGGLEPWTVRSTPLRLA